MHIPCRSLAAVACAIGLAFAVAAPGHADETPGGDAPPQPSPFPDTTVITAYYKKQNPEEFFVPGHPGVWFQSPSGLNCGMWNWGSFGCSGDIPGAPPGDNHIAWYNGNRAVHHGWTAAIQFPAGQAQRPLPPLSYLTFEQTLCATTLEGNTYCTHGPFGLFLTPQGTWFKGWDDRRSYVCNSYGTCPPG